MKKWIWYVVALVSLFSMTSCQSNKEEAEGKQIVLESKTESFETLEEMERYADVIIRGKRLDEKKDVIHRTEEGYVSWGYSLTGVQIEKIYKDSTGELKVEDRMTILENEAYDKETGVTYHIAGYNQMVVGNSYLLFLKKDKLEDGTVYYVSCGVNYGTVSLTEDGREKPHTSGEVFDGTTFEECKDIWEEARKKYR